MKKNCSNVHRGEIFPEYIVWEVEEDDALLRVLEPRGVQQVGHQGEQTAQTVPLEGQGGIKFPIFTSSLGELREKNMFIGHRRGNYKHTCFL